MSIDEIEVAELRLAPKDRARLAELLLESLEQLADEEIETLWAEEALRRDAELDAEPMSGRPSADVLRDAFAKLASSTARPAKDGIPLAALSQRPRPPALFNERVLCWLLSAGYSRIEARPLPWTQELVGRTQVLNEDAG
jgi:hypothetical protein